MIPIADRTVTLRVGADVTDAQSKLRTLSTTTQQWVQKHEQSINTLSNSFGKVGLALTGLAALAVKKFADFDESMSNVAAATHETAENMALLREASLEAGQRTVFSATEAAGAVEELAKAGISTADILNGALDGALDLAAAGGLGVAEAAGYASVALAQFKLGGSDAAHIADLLAAGAGKAMGDVSDLGMALKQGGLVASQTGLSIEETTAALAAFAKAGLLGSDAGTSLKTMLQRLTPQSDEAQAKFDELGISAYDAQGNFVGLTNFAGQLQDRLSALTPEARNAALSVMFGSDAVRAASVLYSEGEQGIRDWISAVDDQGYAAETAATRLDNLKGDWEQLGGAVETALIGMGEGANGPLRELVQGATDVVNAFSGLPDGVQQGLTAIVGGGGLVLLGMAGLGKLVVGISNARSAFENLGVSAKTAGRIAGGVGGVLAVATIAVTAWADANAEAEASVKAIRESLDEATGAITGNTREIIANELTARHGWWIFKKESASDAARTLGISLGDVTDAIMGNADALARVHEVTRVTGQDSITLADELGISLRDLSIAQGTLETEISDYMARLPKAQAEQLSMNEAINGNTGAMSAAEEQARLTQSAQERLSTAVDDGTESVVEQVDALQELIDAQSDLAGIALSNEQAQIRFEAAIDEATETIKENGRTLDITTEKGRANRTALLEIQDATWLVVESGKAAGDSERELATKMQAGRDAFIEAAEAAGASADEANRLADELNLIPQNVMVGVYVDDAELRAFLENLQRTTAKVRIAVGPGGGGGITKDAARGGLITGPGTGTSDSIPVRLSNGEFVVRAAATARHRPLLEAINAGAPGYAAGGYVQPQYMAAPSYTTAPVSVRASVGDVVARMAPEDIRALGDYIMAASGAGTSAALRSAGSAVRYAGGAL